MTDKEIIQKLIERDPMVTHWFFYIKCRPLILSLMKKVFKYRVEYDELVNETVALLLEKDEYRLRQFDYQSSLCYWLRTCLLRHFIRNGKYMIEDESKEALIPKDDTSTIDMSQQEAKLDIIMLLEELSKTNEREAYVIRRIVLEDAEFAEVANELGTNCDNLYNIKKRAIEDLTKISLGIPLKNKNKKNNKGKKK